MVCCDVEEVVSRDDSDDLGRQLLPGPGIFSFVGYCRRHGRVLQRARGWVLEACRRAGRWRSHDSDMEASQMGGGGDTRAVTQPGSYALPPFPTHGPPPLSPSTRSSSSSLIKG